MCTKILKIRQIPSKNWRKSSNSFKIPSNSFKKPSKVIKYLRNESGNFENFDKYLPKIEENHQDNARKYLNIFKKFSKVNIFKKCSKVLKISSKCIRKIDKHPPNIDENIQIASKNAQK